MPTPDTAAINKQINDALAALTGVAPFPVSINVLLQMDDMLATGEHLLGHPASFGKDVRKLLVELKKTVLSAKVSASANVALSLDDIVALVGKLQEALAGGKLAQLDLPPVVTKLAGGIVDAIPPGLVPLANKLRARAPADVLANLLAGTDANTLSAARRGIAAKVADIAAAGSKLVPITVRLESLQVAIGEIALEIQSSSKPNFTLLLPKLVHVEAELDVLIGDLTPLLGKVAAKLDAIETAAFTRRMIAAFDAVASALPDAPVQLATLFEPLREARDGLHDLAGGDLTATIDEVVADVRTALEETGIGDIDDNIGDAVDAAIQQVDLVGLKAEVEQTLDEASKWVHDVAAKLPADVRKKLTELSDNIAEIDVDAIVTELADHLDQFSKQYKTAIDALTKGTLITALMEPVDEFVDAELITALGEIDAQLQDLAGELDAIDLEAAAAESRRLIEEIRTNIEDAVKTADLSPAARTAISFGAKALKAIDFENDVVQPIRDELDKADPKPIIARLEAEVAKVRTAVAAVAPAAIVKQLDPPFDRALLAIAPYSYDALKKRVAQEVAKLQAHLDHADPGPLLAQVESEHAKLLAAAKTQADLDPLFRPVELGYAKATAAINRLHDDLAALFGDATEVILALPLELEMAVHEAMAEAAALTGELPDFKLGDILRPLAEVVEELRARVDALSDAELQALVLAAVAPVVFLQNLDDLDAVFGGPVAELDAVWQALTEASESLRVEMETQVALGNTTAIVQLGVRLQAVKPDFTALQAAAQRLVDRIVTPDLIASARRLSDAIVQALPPELLEIDEDTPPREAIERILNAIDPAPLALELDQIGEDIDTDLGICAQQIAAGVVHLVRGVFGVLDAGNVDDALQTALDDVVAQLALLDPKPVKESLQAAADGVVLLIENLSPNKMKEELDALIATIRQQLNAIGPAVNSVVAQLETMFPFPDLSGDRPSKAFASLVESAEALQDKLDKILAFNFGEPLLRTIDRLRPALAEVLDDVFHELARLLEFMEKQQKAA